MSRLFQSIALLSVSQTRTVSLGGLEGEVQSGTVDGSCGKTGGVFFGMAAPFPRRCPRCSEADVVPPPHPQGVVAAAAPIADNRSGETRPRGAKKLEELLG